MARDDEPPNKDPEGGAAREGRGAGDDVPTPAADLIIESLRVDLPEPEGGLDASESASLAPPDDLRVGIGARESTTGSVESPAESSPRAPEPEREGAVSWQRRQAASRIERWTGTLDSRQTAIEERIQRIEGRIGKLLDAATAESDDG